MAEEKSQELHHPNRFITDNDPSGKAIFSTEIPEQIPYRQVPNDAKFALCYATNEFPVDFTANRDITTYKNYLVDQPGIIIPGGTVLRYVDMYPGATSPMHRTISLDYGVVLEGEVELILDSGEKRLMKRGDLSVQRGTMHAWRNTSQTQWARMLYILQESKLLKIGGKELGEDYGGLEGMKPSNH
jgi:quercetin dioxygenase-like cupin family protein